MSPRSPVRLLSLVSLGGSREREYRSDVLLREFDSHLLHQIRTHSPLLVLSLEPKIEFVNRQAFEKSTRQDRVLEEMEKARLKALLLEKIEIKRLNDLTNRKPKDL